MLTKDKVIELFFMADGFCKFFDLMMAKYTLKTLGNVPIIKNQPSQRQKSCLSSSVS